jgi:AraC-like DNA-binding protein
MLKLKDLEKGKEIRDFLEKNYPDNHTYSSLVKRFGINRLKLKLIFKAVTENNVHEYLIKIRIEHAKKLLETSDLNVGLIAVKVGLDKSNLNIQFKKLTGSTPSQWRNNNNPDFEQYKYEPLAANSKQHTGKTVLRTK